MKTTTHVHEQDLRAFITLAFERVGVPASDAAIAADVLVEADLRGVESHGVARLHHYLDRIRRGLTTPLARLTVLRESPTTLALDAQNSLGMPAAYQAMQRCIERATQYGVAAVTVRTGNHFGIAAYYAMLALPHDLIGLAMTNASPIVVPFGGTQPMLGTNPQAWAIPCGDEPAIVLDMATSAVSLGKIELALRSGKPLPSGWALGADGQPTSDAAEALEVRSLLPLGGLSEGVGYKGFGLALIVEALTYALAGAAMSLDIIGVQARGAQASNIGHFFAAVRVDGFRDPAEFKRDMDTLVQTMRRCPPLPGVERVLVPGEKEHLASLERRRTGIPLAPEVTASLSAIAADLGITPIV